jgi:hypothetical protein
VLSRSLSIVREKGERREAGEGVSRPGLGPEGMEVDWARKRRWATPVGEREEREGWAGKRGGWAREEGSPRDRGKGFSFFI